MQKALLFLAFLVAYVAWALACAWCLKKLQTGLLAGKSFWNGQLMLLLGIAGMFGFIYLLSGLWSLKLVALIFVASQIGTIIGWVPNAIAGNHPEKAGIRTLLAGREIDVTQPKAMKALGIVCILIALAYPIVASILFFQHPWGSLILQVLEVKYTVLLLNLSNYVVVLYVNGSILASGNLDEDTRQRIFINQISALIPIAVYIALALWAFGLGGSPYTFNFLVIPARTLSLQTLFLLLAFFTVAVLIPYLIGAHRGRTLNLDLLERFRSYVADLADILEAPTGALYVAKLSDFQKKIDQEKDEYSSNDAMLTFDEDAKKNPSTVSAENQWIVDAIKKTRDMDPRFSFVDNLSELAKELEEIIADLQQRAGDTIEDAAARWSKRYETRKAEVARKIESAASGKSLITAGVGALVTTIVSGMLSEVAKTAWQWIAETHT